MSPGIETEGKCAVCNSTYSRRQMARHLAQCAYPDGKDLADATQIRVDMPGSPFWLDLDIKTNATLRQLDTFLRDIWLECCGHLSSFTVGQTRYEYYGAEAGERSMNARISAALPAVGSGFTYEYDYGSTTNLRLKVVAQRQAPTRRNAVRLLARNDAPVWNCSDCAQPATSICTCCGDEDDAFSCDVHVGKHQCGEEAMLPIVNSPRIGVCAYTGED
jgi:Plasmid pRiA4b ORF-3-like protein